MRPGRLGVGHDGRVTGPTNIKYNSPLPCVNGSFGGGAMMGVVMHTMADDPPDRPAAHFGIVQDSEIWQYGPIGKRWEAWHADVWVGGGRPVRVPGDGFGVVAGQLPFGISLAMTGACSRCEKVTSEACRASTRAGK